MSFRDVGYGGPALPPNRSLKAERSGKSDDELDAEATAKLKRKILGYIRMSDRHEQARRRTDRTGGNVYYGRHWNVQVATNRAAITCNVAKALIDHKIAIMTKQQPLPVVETKDVGDVEGAKNMRKAIMGFWERDDLQRKLERALYLANSTRSCAAKACWDTALSEGDGDLTWDVLPGWKLIVDDRTDDPERMMFAGDRAMMPRARAITLYKAAAEKIAKHPAASQSGGSAAGMGTGTPIRDQWQKQSLSAPTTAIINSVPTLMSYSGSPPSQSESQDIVQIAELCIRDFGLIKIKREKLDKQGQNEMEPETDEEGLPQFKHVGDEHHEGELGLVYRVPKFELQLKPVIETVRIRKYPQWRRITMLLPDAEIIEDIAWDYPLPYAYCHDGDVLEGFWRLGSILSLESMQGALNVSLSTMLDNMRFSAYRAYLAYSGSMIERNNMNIAPGEILRAGEKGTVEPLPVTEISQAWFAWINLVISLMEKVIGATGVMQGESAGRVDSAQGYDILAEIGGSTLVKCTQRMERFISDIARITGAFMQKHYYDGKRSLAHDDAQGMEHWERIEPGSLNGKFEYSVVTGSSMAWSESAVRERIFDELAKGLRDKISAWKALHIDDWQGILQRQLDPNLPPVLGLSPPARTRQPLPPRPKPAAAS